MNEQHRPGDRLKENRSEFDRLIALAEAEADRRRGDAAAARLQSAARFAWFNHPGVFRDARWERAAARIAEYVGAGAGSGFPATKNHVIHVVTQAYELGGHTRLIARWIENDAERTHSLVLTGQQGLPVPSGLLAAVAGSGGHVIDLGHTSSLVSRARMLGELAAGDARALVLHTHPYDVVPSLGLRRAKTKVVFLNHADHVFSTGIDVADVVADIRPAGQRLSRAARGVVAHDSVLVPLPLAAAPAVDREAARKALGIPEESVLLLSIASEYKFGAVGEEHFAAVHGDLLARTPNARLLVVGPAPTGVWAELSDRTGGRACALGPRSDVAAIYAAADVYLDSMPFSSLTSLLDAALRGVPVAALTKRRTHTVLSADDLSFAGMSTEFWEKQEYLAHLERLISDSEFRRMSGLATREAVEQHHVVPNWLTYVDALLARLEKNDVDDGEDAETAVPLAERGVDRDWLDAELVSFQIASGLAEPLWLAQLRDAPYGPIRMRLRAFGEVPRGQRLRALTFLMPDAMRSRVKKLARR